MLYLGMLGGQDRAMFPRPTLLLLSFFALSLCFASSAVAAPANDHFANAQVIVVDQPLPITVTGDTTGATIETEESALDPTLAASVWFKVTSPADGVVRIDTAGSNYATRLAVAVGASYAALSLIAVDDEPADGTAVTFEVVQGVEYRIAVFGFNGQTGNLSLTLRETEGASISGNVTALAGGAALAHLSVQAYIYNAVLDAWWPVAQTVTNDLGGYTLGGLQIGANYRVGVVDSLGTYAPRYHTGATFVDDALSVTPDADLFDIDFALPVGSTISGVVRDTGGTGIGGITVRAFAGNATAAEWQPAAAVVSNADGSYALGGLAPATYHLSFTDEEAHRYFTAYLGGGSSIETAQDVVVAAAQIYPGRDASLQAAGRFQGTVGLRATGLPAPGIIVQALAWNSVESSWDPVGTPAVTAADGTYTVSGLPFDTYKVAFLSFSDASMPPDFFGATEPEAGTPVVLTGADPVASGIDHLLSPAGTVSLSPAAGGQFALSAQGNPFAQYALQTSRDLSNWEAVGLPFNPDFGIGQLLVEPIAGANAQFWRMEGTRNLGLSPLPGIHQRTSHAVTQANYRWVNRYQFVSGGFLSAFGYGDFDGDGKTDALAFPGQFLTLVPFAAQLTLDIDGASGNGSAVFDGAVPGALHPRKLLVGDLNGDLVDDAVLIDHGYDADPFPGAPLQVLLSTPTGKLVTTIYPEHTGFHHAGALGDIDHDGDLDLFLASPKDLGDINLILLNDGLGAFTPSAQLTGDIWDKNIWVSEFFDLDGDGYLELAIGGSVGTDPAAILWGSSLGSYGHQNTPLTLPTGWEVYDYDAEDVDGDGDRDLLVTLANLTDATHQFKLFINHGNRVFVDETASRFDDPTHGAQWIDFVFVQDVDSDGDLDILTDIGGGGLLKWENSGIGRFTRRQF